VATLTYAQLEGLWIQAGGDPSQAATMAAVALAESGGNPSALNATDNGGKQSSYGLWQVSTGTHTAPSPGWADPLTNAQLAVQKMQTQGITAWGTYDSGLYQQFMESNVAPATDTSDSQGGPSAGNEPSTSSATAVNSPQDFANAVLAQLGAPTSQANVNFLVAWMAREGGNWGNTASYNPLNTTQQMPGSTVMSGGNSANVQAYTSWAQGIQATVQTLQNGNYGKIVQALQSGNPDTANANGTLGSELSTWSGAGYTQVDLADANYNPGSSPYTNQGQVTSSGSGLSSSGQATNNLFPDASTQTPSGVNDPGQYTSMALVNQYITTNYPDMAWMLQVPDLSNILENIVQGVLENNNTAGLSESAIAQQVEASPWWQTTSASLQQYDANLATSPGDYNPSTAFNIPGSVLSKNLSVVQNTAASQGVTLTLQEAQSLAVQMTEFGWNTQQIQQGIGSTVSVTGATGNNNPFSSITGGATTTDAGSIVQQLNTIAGQYAQLQSNSSLQQWASQIAAGTQSINSFTAAMAQQASGQYPALSSGVAQGQSVTQLLQSQINQMAQLLEVDPSEIETGLLTNPAYSKILTGGTSPASGSGSVGTGTTSSPAQSFSLSSGGTTASRVSGGTPMTTSEVAQYTRGLPAWQTTQNARDTGAQASQAILQAFGASPIG
jgi:hypothetical protein